MDHALEAVAHRYAVKKVLIKGAPEGLLNYQKETPAQVFSREIFEIFKNIFFYRTPPVAASPHSCPTF